MGGKSGKPGAPSSGGGAGMSYKNPVGSQQWGDQGSGTMGGMASQAGSALGGGGMGAGLQAFQPPVNPVTGMGGPAAPAPEYDGAMLKDNSDPAGAGMGMAPQEQDMATRQATLNRFAQGGLARGQRSPMMHTGAGGKKSGRPAQPDAAMMGQMGGPSAAPPAPTGSMGGSTELNAPGMGGRSMEQVLQQMRAARGG